MDSIFHANQRIVHECEEEYNDTNTDHGRFMMQYDSEIAALQVTIAEQSESLSKNERLIKLLTTQVSRALNQMLKCDGAAQTTDDQK